MQGTLSVDGDVRPVSVDAVNELLSAGTFFWLDLGSGVDDEGASLLRDRLGFHPLAVEDAQHFGQRPKLDDYGGYVLLVVHGAPDKLGEPTVEVHCFVAEKYVVTVHHGCPALDQVRDHLRTHPVSQVAGEGFSVVYLVVDGLVDGFFPVLGTIDDRIDSLEDAILEQPTESQLGQLFDLKRALVGFRKIITPERDLFAAVVGGVTPFPGMNEEGERYFRDLYDHLIRISELVDGYRDLLTSAMDTHLSMVSNRLNVVMKQLTIIATVFLPLSFLTGFFGQNFAWIVNRIGSLWAFLGLGLGLELVAAVGLMILFRRRGWLSGSSV